MSPPDRRAAVAARTWQPAQDPCFDALSASGVLLDLHWPGSIARKRKGTCKASGVVELLFDA